MAIHHGKGGQVKVGGTPTLVASVTKWSLSESVDVADSTAMGDAAQNHIAGIPKWNGSIDAQYDPADTAGQVTLTIGASISLKLYSDGSAAGKKYKSGTATITGISVDTALTDVVKTSFTFEGNGALTTATAP